MTSSNFVSEIGEVEDIFELQERFYANGWTDGLPVLPPTPERVARFLTANHYDPADVITVIPTRNRAITAEKVAINAVMAGCRPEYMPIIVTVLSAMATPEFRFHGSITSTGGSAQFIVVNGPIRHELGLNGGANCFGPGNRANATIGRAIRLILINVAGATPGILDKSTQGQAAKYTFCIAELEEASPWEPLHVDAGFSPDTNVVTVFASGAAHNIENHAAEDPLALLDCIAAEVGGMGCFSLGQSALVLSPEHAQLIARLGWSRQQVKQYVFDHATQPVAELRRLGKLDTILDRFVAESRDDDWLERLAREGVRPADAVKLAEIGEKLRRNELTHLSRGLGPDDILLLVAGGEAGGHSTFVSSWSRTRSSIFQTRAINRIGSAAASASPTRRITL